MRISDWSSDVCSSDLAPASSDPPSAARSWASRRPFAALNPHDLRMLAAQPQLGRTEQTVDDEIRRPHPVVDQLHIAFGPDHEQRRQPAPADVRRELYATLCPASAST